MTRYLKSAAKLDSSKELSDDVCGTGLRNGATTTMYAAGLDLATVTVRGGWTMSGSNSAEYFICERYNFYDVTNVYSCLKCCLAFM